MAIILQVLYFMSIKLTKYKLLKNFQINFFLGSVLYLKNLFYSFMFIVGLNIINKLQYC